MNSLARIWTIAVNTLREAVRDKLLYTLLFFAILLIGAGAVLSALSYAESERILQDIGFIEVENDVAVFICRFGLRRLRRRLGELPGRQRLRHLRPAL